MSRIVELTPKEISRLRESIIRSYHSRNSDTKELVLNSYLSNYEPLVQDMHAQFPDQLASITASRLRKLFYYSPDVTNTVHSIRFGNDFVIICKAYAESGNQEIQFSTQPYSPSRFPKLLRKNWFIVLSIMLVIILSVFPISPSDSDDVNKSIWEEHFDRNDFEYLKNNGWHIKDINEHFIHEQNQAGKFTLYTLPGSFWTKPEESISVPNTLFRELPKTSQGVRVKLDAFLPYQDWQGVGICLFDESMSTSDIVVLGFGYSKNVDTTQGTPFVYSAYRLRNGIPDRPFLSLLAHPEMSDGNALRLDISWNKQNIYFGVGINDDAGFTQEWEPFKIIGDLKISFKPTHVGFYACQGWTNDQRQPLHADTIPAYLDWVQIY